MNFLSRFTNEEVILVVPNELKKYFLELRKDEPSLNFKLLSLGNLFNELRGNYLNKLAIQEAYKIFPEYTYNSIKEVLEIIYHSFKIEESHDERLIKLSSYLKENKLLFENDDLKLLMQNRKVIFINFNESTLIKSLIKYLDIKNYELLKIDDVIDTLTTSKCYRFFNIIDETHYGINEILYEVYNKKSSKNIRVILDTNRFEFYITCLLGQIDVPYSINGTRSLIDTKTYKFIYNNINDDSLNVLDLLKNNKEQLEDEYFDDIYKTLEDIGIDTLQNKKTNIYEILSSRSISDKNICNAINFSNGVYFSRHDSIYVFGLDNGYMPKAKKNNKLFSYEFRNKLGLDSLNEVNTMKSNLEKVFLRQKNIKFISYHVKDNSGRYGPSYYLDSLGIKVQETPVQKYDFNLGVAKTIYSNYVDKFIKSGETSKALALYKNYFKDKKLKLYSNHFTGINDYKFNNEKSYSYSSLSRYHECPFKFYLNDVLHLGEFESNTHSKFGNLAHDTLLNIYKDGYDFKNEFIKTYNKMNEEEPFTKAQNILLRRYYKEIEKSALNILEHKKDMLFKTDYSEKSFYLNEKYEFDLIKNDDIVSEEFNIKLYGRVDSILETTSDTLYIIDYKSGAEEFSKKGFLEKNKSTQLPFYYYLVRNSNDKELKNSTIDGCFIKPLLVNKGKFYNIYNLDEEDLNSTKFGGFFYGDFDSVSKFDTTLINKDPKKDDLSSKYVLNLKLNKTKEKGKQNLGVKKTNQSLQMENFSEFETVIKKYIANSIYGIATSKFEIAPLIDSQNSPCKFCDFKDVCLKSLANEDEESEDNEDE